MDYGNCGLYDDAILVLTRYVESAEQSKIHPLACYYIGYYSAKKGDEKKAMEYCRMAALMSAEYCFPFQLECVDVLQDAMKRNPQDARAAYYLGNLLYDLQPEGAVALWEQSRQIDAKFATVHRNLGFAYARVRKDNGKAIASLEQAIACDARDPKFYAELDALYEAGNVDPQKRLALLEKNHAVVAQRDDGLLREITLHMLAGNYDRAIALFEGHHFRLWEGEGGLHDIYADAHLLRGQTRFAAGQYAEAKKDYEAAMQYPESLETAKPTRGEGKLPQINYLLGLVYEATGQADEARSAFQQATAGARRAGGNQLLPGPGPAQARAREQGDGDLRQAHQHRPGAITGGGRPGLFCQVRHQAVASGPAGASILPDRAGPPRQGADGRGE